MGVLEEITRAGKKGRCAETFYLFGQILGRYTNPDAKALWFFYLTKSHPARFFKSSI